MLPLLSLACVAAQSAITTTVVDVPNGAVTQRFLYVRPDTPRANVVVWIGGTGYLSIQNDGTIASTAALCNPMIRNQQVIAADGLSLALMGEDSTGDVWNFADLVQVIHYMQAHDNVPTWIVGASASTYSAISAAVNLPAGDPVGLVVFSPIPVLPALAAGDERPTLVLYQAYDANAQYAGPLYSELTSAAIKQLTGINAGDNNGCGFHLFNGADTEFVAAVTGFIDQYNGSLSAPAETQLAVEYYYADWNFYFVTSNPAEIAALDGGAFGGLWKRTGQTFTVWTGPTGGALPTCRFFSVIFAPRSSHFYTDRADECAQLKSNPGWQYEAIAFYLQPLTASFDCPAGTVILYRLFNNGMGGAPNHRFITDVTEVARMTAAGWSLEGDGPKIAYACVLPQPGQASTSRAAFGPLARHR
jgi:hypothetical protein